MSRSSASAEGRAWPAPAGDGDNATPGLARHRPPAQGTSRRSLGALSVCLDWRVIAAAGAVVAGVAVIAPGVLAVALPILVVAACPLSMGLMAWGMARNAGSRRPGGEASEAEGDAYGGGHGSTSAS
jgi:hypothetical protein